VTYFNFRCLVNAAELTSLPDGGYIPNKERRFFREELMMTRCTPWLAWLLFAGLVVLPQSVLAQSRGLKKVAVGVPAVSMGNIVIFFTKEAKIYEKHGLDAEAVVMSGSGIASRALIAGSVIISPITTPAVMSAVLAGSDMVILAHTMPGGDPIARRSPGNKAGRGSQGKDSRCHDFRFSGRFPGAISGEAKGTNAG
jgi:hypothetical protein